MSAFSHGTCCIFSARRKFSREWVVFNVFRVRRIPVLSSHPILIHVYQLITCRQYTYITSLSRSHLICKEIVHSSFRSSFYELTTSTDHNVYIIYMLHDSFQHICACSTYCCRWFIFFVRFVIVGFICHNVGIQNNQCIVAHWLAWRWEASRSTNMRLPKWTMPQGWHTHHIDGDCRCSGVDAILCHGHHDEHLSQMEDRAGDRRPTVENRFGRDQRLFQQWHCVVAQ